MSATPGAIAIVGMTGRFPGAQNVPEFWENLLAGRDGIAHFAEPEFSIATAEAKARGERFVGARGVLDQVEMFDAEFFGIQPREAELMDPQHRVFLECAWEALESAGHDPTTYPDLIGVFAGLSLNTYLLNNLGGDTAVKLPGQYQVGEYQAMLGNDKDFMPTRVAYKLNLRGPCMAIQTACSTSLVAVSQACTALQTFQCDMALAGGVSITFPQRRDYLYQEEGMVSPDGTCRAFDAEARGTVFGHGCAIVVLKRLEDALADGNTILATIRGCAVNNDGSNKIGYAAPSVTAQAEVIAMAQAVAGVSPQSISCVEAHGTGTPLGDPIEVAALTQAFREGGAQGNGFCHLATGKTHIGHLDVAAGATGLIKATLQLQHGLIPGMRHFQSPNPRIDFADSPFLPVAETVAWPRGTEPRRAGVSAFGVGGTNAHVVVEEAPLAVESASFRASQVLMLSARTPATLARAAANLSAHLEKNPGVSLADVSFTLARGRRNFPFRQSVVALDAASAAITLSKPFTPEEAVDAEVVFLFPGQGSQTLDMGKGLYETEPVFREAMDEAAAILQSYLGVNVLAVIYPDSDDREEASALIHQTIYAQPGIFLVEYALAKLWLSWGIRPAALIGHSVGELVAGVVGGAFSLEDALRLLAGRARLMQDLPPGAMLAVRVGVEELQGSLPKGIEISAVNSPMLSVVSGPREALENFQSDLTAQRIPSAFLSAAHAFHSAEMQPVARPLTELAATIRPRDFVIPWVSTCTGGWMTAEDLADPAYWARQLCQPVLFAQAVQTLAERNFTTFLECGQGRALSTLVKQNLSKVRTATSLQEGLPDLAAAQSALGELWRAGITPDWTRYFSGENRRRIPLPTYPFEKKHFWIDQPRAAQTQKDPEPVEEAVPVVSEPENPQDRPARLVSEILALLKDLSGRDDLDPQARFTDLGFDSLFLTQVSQAILTRFGVRVAFRQLLGEISNVETLAEYLGANLPTESVRPKITGEQRFGLPVIRRRTTPAAQGPVRFGPYRPVEIREDGQLSDRQRRALDELIARYVKRTANSRDYAAKHRPHYADPRAVAGFQPLWKEMVYPLVCERSAGSTVWDVDGHAYVDVTMGFGTYFFGHSPDWLVRALREQLDRGIEIGPQSAAAGAIARDLGLLTGHERVTFCNTGSEAVMAALRLARTVTGRQRVAYFAGDYHGMFDEVLVRGSWVDGEYRAQPAAPGIPPSLVANMLVLDYAAPESLEILRAHAHELAAVLVEPVQSRQPGLQPRAFLQELRALTTRAGAALIFDEVVTGFRCDLGGAQTYFGVRADLATYGKVVGGGIPIGILAGSRQFMDPLDGGAWTYGDDSFPEVGMTFFAGTFVRHPLAMAAARSVIDHLKAEGPGLQINMAERTGRLCRALTEQFARAGVPIRVPHFSAFAVIEHAPDLRFASLLWYYLRERGIHIWENRPLYLTTAHSDEDFDKVLRAFADSVGEMQEAGFLPLPPPPTSLGLVAESIGFPRVDRAPITEAQREIWASARLSDDSNRAFNESNTIEFDGSLDRAALEKALLLIIQRHAALRSTVSEDGDWQIFHPPPRILPLEVVDLSAGSEEERAARYATLRAQGTGVAFDLVKGPLLRLVLVVMGPERHALLFNVHHLVCDGWSFGMIVDELSRSYNAYRVGSPPLLPPPLPFGDYARDLVAQGPAEVDRDYWIAQFRDNLPADLELPTDHPRPPLKSYAGAMETLEIDEERFARIKEASPNLGGTLFVTLLSTFATLLHRLSGQEDIVIGVPSAGQTLTGRDELVGHCLNFLPLRLHCTGDSLFSDFVERVRQTVLDAYDHQSFTFGSLVRALRLNRDASRVPLVSVMFNIDRSGFDQLAFAGLDFRVLTNAKQFVNFDLFFNLVQSDHRLEIECEYNTDLYDATTIRRWLGSFEALIESTLSAPMMPEVPLENLRVLPPETQKMLVQTWNDTGREYPRERGVHEIITEIAGQFPGKVAVRCGDGALTYMQLEEEATRLAARLKAIGVTPGRLVGLCVERSLDMVVGMVGILKSGAAYVPMDPAFPAERLGFMFEDAQLAAVVTRREAAKALPPHEASVVLLDEPWAGRVDDFVPSQGGGEELAYVIFTSGSTGRPKGVRISHAALVNLLAAMRREPGLKADDILFSVTTLSFDICGLEIFLPLTTGATVVVGTGDVVIDGFLLGSELDRTAATVMQATPATWRLLIEAGWSGPQGFKILIGGEAVPRDLVNQLLPRCGSIWNVYGPTETTIWSTTARLTADTGPVLIGRPIDNTQVYIVNSGLALQPVGVPGELLIGGDGLAQGYHERDDLTADRFIRDPFSLRPEARLYRTGDLARWRPDGQLECLGRLDHQVKIRGHRIELGEIEAVLEQHPAIAQAVVVTRQDTPGDIRLVAYFTVAEGDPGHTLRTYLRTRLPGYMVPSVFVRLAKFPLTPNAKVDRRALPVPDAGAVTAPSSAIHVAPSTEAEKALAEIWQEVLKVGRVGVTDDIFDLGGDSILIFQIVARASQVGLAIRPAQMFQSRTIADLLEEVAASSPANPQPVPIPLIPRLKRETYRRKP